MPTAKAHQTTIKNGFPRINSKRMMGQTQMGDGMWEGVKMHHCTWTCERLWPSFLKCRFSQWYVAMGHTLCSGMPGVGNFHPPHAGQSNPITPAKKKDSSCLFGCGGTTHPVTSYNFRATCDASLVEHIFD